MKKPFISDPSCKFDGPIWVAKNKFNTRRNRRRAARRWDNLLFYSTPRTAEEQRQIELYNGKWIFDTLSRWGSNLQGKHSAMKIFSRQTGYKLRFCHRCFDRYVSDCVTKIASQYQTDPNP